MPKYQLTELALADLAEIQSYITIESDFEIADRVVDSIFERFDLLAENNKIGMLIEDFPKEIRRFVFLRYLILYLPTSYGVEILRVLHSARDTDSIVENDLIN